MSDAPLNPAGPFNPVDAFSEAVRDAAVAEIAAAPTALRDTVAGLDDRQLDTKYRNWTIRQIVHHVADSHLHSVVRFKWALTEDTPTIKAYEEADWVALADSRAGDVDPPLMLLDGLHAKWVQLLRLMTPDQYERSFVHPQTGETVRLWTTLQNYAWHGRHHTAQIRWLRDARGW